ncbi:hypothetical protein FACS1894216_20170 [Synergistales bacterium]|nr:hypothetical protein FACS1894216_20170 [Synergistales bacterium]
MLWLTSCPILKISKPPYIDISVLIILKLKHYNTFGSDYGQESMLEAAGGETYFQAPPATAAEATKGGNTLVRKAIDKSNDLKMIRDLGGSPNMAAKRHVKFRPFYELTKKAYETQERMRASFGRNADAIFGKAGLFGRKGGLVTSKQGRETFFNILM